MRRVKSKVDEKTTYRVTDKYITILRDGESATVRYSTLEQFANRLKEEFKNELLAIRLEQRGRDCPICNGRFYNAKANIYCSQECAKVAKHRNIKKQQELRKKQENSEKPKNRKSQLSEINNKAKALGMSYGQYQAMRYKETLRW